MIKPTIGRVVWYWPAATETDICSGGEQALPALIAHVHNDTCVNIGGFDSNGQPFARPNVYLHQEEIPRPTDDFAEWMPYQKDQAAKTEQAEVEPAGATETEESV